MEELSPSLKLKVESTISFGERVLWYSQPSPFRLFVKSLFTSLVFLAFFGVFFAAWSNSDHSEISPFWIYFQLFICIGFLLNPFLKAIFAFYSVYVITDQKVIIIERNFFSVSITQIRPENFSSFRIEHNFTQYSDFFFHRIIEIDSDGDKKMKDIGFYGIKDIKQVEKLLNDLRRS